MADKQKSRKSRSKIRIAAIIVCFIVFIASLTYVVNEIVINPYKNNNSVGEAKELFYEAEEDTEAQQENKDKGKRLKKFDKLTEKNSDVKGWIKIEGTNIDYPVLQSQKDDIEKGYYYYLDYDWQGNVSKLGSISLMKDVDIAEDNVFVLFGHNIDYPPCMFHDLLKYKDAEFYKKYPIINFDTLYEEQDFVVFGAMVIESDEQEKNILQSQFSNEQLAEHLEWIKEKSVIETNVPVDSSDKILVLYTCSYETNTSRTVVVARKMRENEKIENYLRD